MLGAGCYCGLDLGECDAGGCVVDVGVVGWEVEGGDD